MTINFLNGHLDEFPANPRDKRGEYFQQDIKVMESDDDSRLQLE